MIKALIVTLGLSWFAAHAIAIPAQHFYGAIFQPIDDALTGH